MRHEVNYDSALSFIIPANPAKGRPCRPSAPQDDPGGVRIPPDLVQKAMSTAPRSFVLGGREERFDLHLDGSCSYLCTDGTGVHVADLETRELRASRKEDVAMMARVCDALPLISFYWPLVSAQDYGVTAPLHQCHAGLTNTLKHVRGGMTVPPRLAP